MSLVRKTRAIPPAIILLLIAAIVGQIAYNNTQVRHTATFTPLTEPLSEVQYQLLSMGSTRLITHLLTLKLQLHDNQKGKHYNYHYLDYDVLAKRLTLLQKMNTQTDYPALLAARVFVNTSNQQQLHSISQTVIKLFQYNPEKNWRWLAEMTILAKYHLKDLPLALSMAKLLSAQPKSSNIPAWARDLEFLMLEEMNQYDAAIYIVEQNLKDTQDLSNDEIRFLQTRLSALKQKSVEISTK